MKASTLIRDMKICNVEGTMNNQILLTGGYGQGKKGFLNIIRYGLKLRSVVSINCSAPHGIWTVKKNVNDKYHSFVVITYNQSRKTLTFHIENNKLVCLPDFE